MLDDVDGVCNWKLIAWNSVGACCITFAGIPLAWFFLKDKDTDGGVYSLKLAIRALCD